MNSLPRTARGVLVVLATTALLGCGESPTGPAAGEFELSVSGSIGKSLQGSAAFATPTSSQANRRVWVLDLDEGKNELFLRLGIASIPAPGQYEVEPPPVSDADTLADGKAYFSFDLITDDSTRYVFVSESGTLVIEESLASEVRGRLTFETDSGFAPDGDESTGPLSGDASFRAEDNPRKALDSRILPNFPVLP